MRQYRSAAAIVEEGPDDIGIENNLDLIPSAGVIAAFGLDDRYGHFRRWDDGACCAAARGGGAGGGATRIWPPPGLSLSRESS